jgi:GGDEF domain-containing protein
VLLEARRELADRRDRRGIAEISARRAREVSDAGYASLVVRSVEGPRVLWQEPGGTGARQIWGPQTLGALLKLSEPLCDVLGSDPLSADGPTALLAVPVPAGGALVGTLLVRRRAECPFTPSDRDAVSRLARMTGAALDRHARRGDVHREDDVDTVTDLPRHSRLLQDLRQALTGVEQHGMPLALVLLRLPGLRRLGTQKGRTEADRALKDVVRHLYSALRVGDVMYRFGQEELAVLLPGTDSGAAQAVAERIRAEVVARVPPDGELSGPEDGSTGSRGNTDRNPVPIIVRPVTGVAEDVLGSAVRGLWEADRA